METADATAEQDRFAYEFGIRLEAARMTLQLTPADMCKLLGCARSTYTQYIRGGSMIAAQRLAPLVKRGISSDYLLFNVKTAIPAGLIKDLEENEQTAKIERDKPQNKGRRDL
ncbi:helix-turn-helix domain-containing protein [Azospirillum rugosum]|uniref:Transcriptional regulator with XRE-family HTH domain n=1 Tax=Azospirillum rugosum TaxID=416170 RepID=A0ABS4SEU0_9PROT|nr:helix-turn-helix transcriptional regulator [Azospirillum rugosum]MBP2291012.1 transcriptional regulator with XRE-family HTH domain [Azospirillum rugosum]MDQ0524924.1 transcriptional regulator with XRE-family HTH domain [Azospirillum rugosum]